MLLPRNRAAYCCTIRYEKKKKLKTKRLKTWQNIARESIPFKFHRILQGPEHTYAINYTCKVTTIGYFC